MIHVIASHHSDLGYILYFIHILKTCDGHVNIYLNTHALLTYNTQLLPFPPKTHQPNSTLH